MANSSLSIIAECFVGTCTPLLVRFEDAGSGFFGGCFAACCLCASLVLLYFVLFGAVFAVDLVALVLFTSATCLLRL
jgi:hypothetical protein